MSTPFSTPATRLALAAKVALMAAPAAAGELSVTLDLPEIEANPYRNPYLAVWVEDDARAMRGTLAVWYDTRLRRNIGVQFLSSLRTWWRAEGEAMTLPADGVSGPTRPAGSHELRFGADNPVLKDLPAGDWVLAVEVVREEGGREILRLPFTWGAGAATPEARAEGKHEIAALAVTALP